MESNPPPPPPLPLTSQVQLRISSPSPFLDKLASAPENYLRDIPTTPYEPPVYEPTFYFFYGTLTKPEVLSRILDLTEPPQLRPAQVEGYSLSSWGQYPALIDGPPGNLVQGFAFQVQTEEDEEKLAYYETKAYECMPCVIAFTDGAEPTKVDGNTFMYAGDAVALQEGRFDRKLWERQMGQSLPTLKSIKMGSES
ncbi:MAG: hypothetical protein M1834_008045 [Cirrosporium novae-zelandiae]|nr:MAG: hypothetical protein M1834_008045 [Cirrosporium novae-zelandiae]